MGVRRKTSQASGAPLRQLITTSPERKKLAKSMIRYLYFFHSFHRSQDIHVSVTAGKKIKQYTSQAVFF